MLNEESIRQGMDAKYRGAIEALQMAYIKLKAEDTIIAESGYNIIKDLIVSYDCQRMYNQDMLYKLREKELKRGKVSV